MDLYQQYIHISRYARWRDDLGRRETWDETVQRYIDFFDARFGNRFSDVLQDKVKQAILNLDVMPSMRALMTAGPALDRENLAGFNCSYLAVNSKESFSEALYILMCGTGVGFSCERQEITKLPNVPHRLELSDDLIVVQDSKKGWAAAYQHLLSHLWTGSIPKINYDLVRPAGARLQTFGGRASGPGPLKKLIDFTIVVFQRACGRKLTSIEVHDIMCMIGEVVVVGGVRRSALISLSNLSDQRMRDAKSGQWWTDNPQRALANNSVAYTETPSAEIFMEEWLSLIKSKSGERGIFNRVAAQKQAAKYGRRDENREYGCNPCSEIILRDHQLCNLSEVVVRAEDTYETIQAKIEVAVILGTMQASLTNFDFVSELWSTNTRDEALLGVSLTGIMDNGWMCSNDEWLPGLLKTLRQFAVHTNAVWAEQLGVKPSAAITCVKPSGTVSQLCNTASGIHARHNRNYIRTVRIDKKDPLYQFMLDKGFVIEDDQARPESTAVVSFPITSPPGAIVRSQVSAIEALELWLTYQRYWCEHKPSVTITVKESEWLEVGAWVYEHFDEVSGISFLPFSDHTYQQAPYQDMRPEEFAEWIAKHPVPDVDWTELGKYEQTDNTISSQTLACVGGSCEIP